MGHWLPIADGCVLSWCAEVHMGEYADEEDHRDDLLHGRLDSSRRLAVTWHLAKRSAISYSFILGRVPGKQNERITARCQKRSIRHQ